jgi:hypothetical protein
MPRQETGQVTLRRRRHGRGGTAFLLCSVEVFIIIIYFGGNTGVRTQGLMLASQVLYCSSLSTSPFLAGFVFEIRS